MTTVNKYTVRVKHDKGYVNITTWAQSPMAAVEIVKSSERCPHSAIVQTKLTPITAGELRGRVESAGHESYFFTRNNMKFAGDTMRNFGVRAAPRVIETYSGEYLCWVLYRRNPVKRGMQGEFYFDVETYRQIHASH